MVVPASASSPLSSTSPGRQWVQISASGGHTCGLDTTGRVYCWGDNTFGQLGVGDQIDRLVPTAVVRFSWGLGGKTVKQISVGPANSCALDTAGKVYCWGLARQGQLGIGDTGILFNDQPMPVDFSGTAPRVVVATISVGYLDVCALSRSGKAYCWGFGEFGQLGTGGYGDVYRPYPVDTSGVLAGVTLKQITLGDYHTCALDSSGQAYCWGAYWDGQLGTLAVVSTGEGNTTNQPVAVDQTRALAGKRLTQITAGDGYTCALDNSGRAYCWGSNRRGKLGTGDTVNRRLPTAVNRTIALAGKRLTRISAGGTHTCAVDTAGRAYCWGSDRQGQLGIGSADHRRRLRPVAMNRSGLLAHVGLTQITTGHRHTCALSQNGRAYCWGVNRRGQLGDGTTLTQRVPVAVAHPST